MYFVHGRLYITILYRVGRALLLFVTMTTNMHLPVTLWVVGGGWWVVASLV